MTRCGPWVAFACGRTRCSAASRSGACRSMTRTTLSFATSTASRPAKSRTTRRAWPYWTADIVDPKTGRWNRHARDEPGLHRLGRPGRNCPAQPRAPGRERPRHHHGAQEMMEQAQLVADGGEPKAVIRDPERNKQPADSQRRAQPDGDRPHRGRRQGPDRAAKGADRERRRWRDFLRGRGGKAPRQPSPLGPAAVDPRRDGCAVGRAPGEAGAGQGVTSSDYDHRPPSISGGGLCFGAVSPSPTLSLVGRGLNGDWQSSFLAVSKPRPTKPSPYEGRGLGEGDTPHRYAYVGRASSTSCGVLAIKNAIDISCRAGAREEVRSLAVLRTVTGHLVHVAHRDDISSFAPFAQRHQQQPASCRSRRIPRRSRSTAENRRMPARDLRGAEVETDD